MAQTYLQRLATRWTWLKYSQMHEMPDIESQLGIRLSYVSRRKLAEINSEIRRVKVLIERDVNEAKRIYKQEHSK